MLYLKSLNDSSIHDLHVLTWLEAHPKPETLQIKPLAYVVSDIGLPEGLLVETRVGNLCIWDRRCFRSVPRRAALAALDRLAPNEYVSAKKPSRA